MLYRLKILFSKYENNKLTVNSLDQVINILNEYKKNKKIDLRKVEKLKSWWGFATQYIVFKKNWKKWINQKKDVKIIEKKY